MKPKKFAGNGLSRTAMLYKIATIPISAEVCYKLSKV
jgi:hypothetical protein